MTLHLACHGLQVIETSEGKLDFAVVHSPVSNSQTTVHRGGVVEAGLRRGTLYTLRLATHKQQFAAVVLLKLDFAAVQVLLLRAFYYRTSRLCGVVAEVLFWRENRKHVTSAAETGGEPAPETRVGPVAF
jgi:hypothetical protein